MAPSAEALEVAIQQGTADIFAAEPDATTVNKVRKHVEATLNLKEGFFTSPEWKQRSKDLIKGLVVSISSAFAPGR